MSYCKDNLSESERRAIAESCFHVTETRGSEMHGLCPFHAEKQASFSYNFEKDMCHCLSCGASGDLIAIWGEVHGHSDNDSAFRAFREQFGSDQPSTFTPSKPAARARANGGQGETTKIISEEDYRKLDALPDEVVRLMTVSWDWTQEIVERLGLRYQQHSGRIAIPIRRDDGAIVNIRLYAPGVADNKLISWGKGYGKSKLFPAPASWKQEPILICEGEKDCITALAKGFNACTQTAGCNSWDDKFNRFFDGRDVVIAYDADEKGIAGAQKVAKKLQRSASSIRIISWPSDIMPEVPDHGQDLTDFFATHGKVPQDLRDLMQRATVISSEKQPQPEHGDCQRFFGGANGRQFKPRLVADEILTWRKIIYDAPSGVFYAWNDRCWEEYDESNIRRQILSMLMDEGTTPRVNDILGLVRDLAAMPHGRKMNDTIGHIPIRNGLFDMEHGKIEAHKPENYNTYIIDIYLDPTFADLPECKLWMKHLDESVDDPDTIIEIQKFFGICLTRETRYEKSLLLVGPGGDGKGTILKMLEAMVGEHNTSNVTLGGLQDQFHRVQLVDKLLNAVTEVEAGLLESDMFKTIVSGEGVSAAFKHKNVFKFKPVCKLAFSANSPPKLRDASDGLLRRLMYIKMEKQFVKQGKADLYLEDKLLEELPGIFLWAVRGLQRLRAEGFKESAYMAACKNEFKEMNNPIYSFVIAHVKEHSVKDRKWTCTMTVYKKYKAFCDKRNYKPLGESRFGAELKRQCESAVRARESSGKRRWGYKNISIIDDYEVPYAS
jgi:putative DNA primase/helicase